MLLVNCWVWPALNVAVVGLTETEIGISVIEAVADLVVSATLVAVTVILSWDAMDAGAEYNPVPEILPTEGDTLHETPFTPCLAPVSEAENCWRCPADRVTDVGCTETLIAPIRPLQNAKYRAIVTINFHFFIITSLLQPSRLCLT